ncbi:hypothetical protein BKA62DRAFT_720074 [Auriculariales sp. MPI-PUGE-AT-0066]|nr:hypothetical protein BKA62DRAFT_720074 [Auriculariales sp. MPI-PUGE-AT-0066]
MSCTRRTPHPVSLLFIFPHSLSAAITVCLLSSTPSILLPFASLTRSCCYAFPCHPCHRFYPTCYPPVISGTQVVSLTRQSSSSSGSHTLRSRPLAAARFPASYPSLPFTAHHGLRAHGLPDVPAPTGSRLIRPVVRLHRPAQRAVVPHACPGPRILVAFAQPTFAAPDVQVDYQFASPTLEYAYPDVKYAFPTYNNTQYDIPQPLSASSDLTASPSLLHGGRDRPPSTSAAARTPSLSLALAILPPARSITDRCVAPCRRPLELFVRYVLPSYLSVVILVPHLSPRVCPAAPRAAAPVLPPPPSILYRACCVCASTMPPSLCPCYNTHCVLALSRLRPSRLRLRPIPSRSITTP